MYLIDKSEGLIGKTIAFAHMAQFADYIMLATTDGGILCVTQIGEDGEKETYIPRRHSMEQYLFENRYFLEELVKNKVITQQDIEDYKAKRKKEIEEARKKYFINQEEADRRNYERLKAKFENKD